jgi:hypothetical protein
MFSLISVALIGLIGGSNLAFAQAATPVATWTPTPTLYLNATPTSHYAGLRITPSPLAVTVVTYEAAIDMQELGGQLADTTINLYRTFNIGGVFDIFSFFALVALSAALLVRIQNRLTKESD